MSIDTSNWRFPIERLIPKSAALCVCKLDDSNIECIGARIEFSSISLPDINYGYKRDRVVEPHVLIDFRFPFSSLEALRHQVFQLEGPVKTCGSHMGSVYLFGAHNPVGCQSIAFGDVIGNQIEATFDLYFDFDFEDSIGGTFRHQLSLPLTLEKRWEPSTSLP